MKRKKIKQATFFVCAWLTLAAGLIGIFVPVLPTTPFLLLSTFLFANSSTKFHNWFCNTAVYKRYVIPFKEKGGLPVADKVRIIVISFVVMGISAVLVPVIYVWIILGAVALWLLFLMFIRIPTIAKENAGANQDGDKK